MEKRKDGEKKRLRNEQIEKRSWWLSFFYNSPVWSPWFVRFGLNPRATQSRRFSIYYFLNLFFSQPIIFSISSFLNLFSFQYVLFSICCFLNLFFSHFILFSIYSFLNPFFSQPPLGNGPVRVLKLKTGNQTFPCAFSIDVKNTFCKKNGGKAEKLATAMVETICSQCIRVTTAN